MKINISDLISKKSDEIQINEKVILNKINRGGDIFYLKGPVEVKGKVFKADEDIIFSGLLETIIQTECSRCLDNVVKDIKISFDESVCDEKNIQEDADVLLEDDCIDLEEFSEKLLILKLPMKFLCSKECKGLCLQCGTNLNNSNCNCEKEDIDIRLIKLKELLKQD
ncbi:MAG: DUF177 domain-containing protein [Clostridia bacterium]|nr:DUF177 domain-containing protein [Clostridia bacterium]